jgi:hypothetical protein
MDFMTTESLTPTTIELPPDWVVAEMPPGYSNRVEEIRRLTADLRDMGRFGRLLSAVGAPLGEAVRDLFASLGFESELTAGPTCSSVSAKLDGRNRLLLHVSNENQVIQKKSPELAHVFQMLHETSEEHDHVALITNPEPAKALAERGEALTPEALAFLARMGASHVASTTLFRLWKLSLDDAERARQYARRLHSHEGGGFLLPATLI